MAFTGINILSPQFDGQLVPDVVTLRDTLKSKV